jgi:hypothetical protein
MTLLPAMVQMQQYSGVCNMTYLLKTCILFFALGVLLRNPALSAEKQIASKIAMVTIAPQGGGRIFEGIGGLSGGASSRLLIDYPEPSRGKILDLLFKPNYGASFHTLKIEMGGSINSTDGIEPTHARTREEFENPREEYFTRGYEWFLMKEAKKRNPGIILDVIQLGNQEWIGEKQFPRADQNEPWEQRKNTNFKKFLTKDNAEFVASYLKGAEKYHGLKIDYTGIWNEMGYTTDYIKLLRKTLDENGLQRVKIVAADDTGPHCWHITHDLLKDKQLLDSVYAIGVHYPGWEIYHGKDIFKSPPEAKDLGIPLWAIEDGSAGGQWDGAVKLARSFNRNYVIGRMTKTVIWSLVTSYYANLPVPNSGPMKANEPWSGHFEIQPAVWAIAHTTQFTRPGWQYLDDACTTLDGGSVAALRSPDKKEVTLVIETVDAVAEQKLSIRSKFSADTLHVWRSTEQSQFDRLEDLKSNDGTFTISVLPKAIYTLTTTTGQRKASPESPPSRDFLLPCTDDFESYPSGKTPKYFSDQGGEFETAKRADGSGLALAQVIAQRGIDWNAHPTPEPYTMLGSSKWRNYEVRCDFSLEQGYAAIFGHIMSSPQSPDPPAGYWLKIDVAGNWQLKAAGDTLASGRISFDPGKWHSMSLKFADQTLSAAIDGIQVFSSQDHRFPAGMVGLGTGWNQAIFDNFSVKPVLTASKNLAEGKKTAASSIWNEDCRAGSATDGDFATRWNAAMEDTKGPWLEIDFGEAIEFGKISFTEFEHRIQSYKVQYWDGAAWIDAYSGNVMPSTTAYQECSFKPVESSKMRLQITRTNGRCPSIYELEVYNLPRR